MAEIPIGMDCEDALAHVHDVAEAGRALLRLEKWRTGNKSRSYSMERDNDYGAACACVDLHWVDPSGNHKVVEVAESGYLRVDNTRQADWHDMDNDPSGLPATIHAALDAAERAEAESN